MIGFLSQPLVCLRILSGFWTLSAEDQPSLTSLGYQLRLKPDKNVLFLINKIYY